MAHLWIASLHSCPFVHVIVFPSDCLQGNTNAFQNDPLTQWEAGPNSLWQERPGNCWCNVSWCLCCVLWWHLPPTQESIKSHSGLVKLPKPAINHTHSTPFTHHDTNTLYRKIPFMCFTQYDKILAHADYIHIYIYICIYIYVNSGETFVF